MDIELGRFRAQLERPETIKFAAPIMLVPELFTTSRHMAVALGYLATIGWEVYAPDYRQALAREPGWERVGLERLVEVVGEALAAIGREAVVWGFGFGASVALKMAERPGAKAAVAVAPLIPGVRTALVTRLAQRWAIRRGAALKPPAGRALWEFLAGVEPRQRAALSEALVPDLSGAAAELARGAVSYAPAPRSAPRLIVAGDRDAYAPLEPLKAFAQSIGAPLSVIRGRGHWLLGGGGLERAVAEAHRFLVRALGQELLLLYPEQWPDESKG